MTFSPHVAAPPGLLYTKDEDTTIIRNVGNYPTTECNISEDPKSTKLLIFSPSSFNCKFVSIEKILIFHEYLMNKPGSSVGIATIYGLDGPGSNPGWDEIFRPSRPALGPTQPSVKRVTGLSRG